jgi:predicted transcriptional regulator
LKEIYGLITNHFNGNEAIEEWDLIPGAHKAQIEKGLEQAEAGLGTSLKDVNESLMAKYNTLSN